MMGRKLKIKATNPASMSRLIIGLINRLVIIFAISFLRVKKLIGFCTKQIPVLVFFNYNKTGNYYWDIDLSQKTNLLIIQNYQSKDVLPTSMVLVPAGFIPGV